MVSFAGDPMTVFSYALKSKHSKRKYPQRFKTFLTFLGYNGQLKDDADTHFSRGRLNPHREQQVPSFGKKIYCKSSWLTLLQILVGRQYEGYKAVKKCQMKGASAWGFFP
jgi:hypothetical protein